MGKKTQFNFERDFERARLDYADEPEFKFNQARAAMEKQTRLIGDPYDILSAVDSKVGRAVKGGRYERVFEELMSYGDASEDRIFDDETLKQELKNALGDTGGSMFSSSRESRKASMAARKFNDMVDKLTRGIAKTKGFVSEYGPIRIREENLAVAEKILILDKREKLFNFVTEGREVYFYPRREEIVYKTFSNYKGRRRAAYRNLDTGRFGKNPRR